MSSLSIDPFAMIGAFVGLIIWFSRLESKTLRNEKDIAKIQDKHDNLETKLISDLNDVKLTLARIEERVGIKKEQL